ncbi:MAG TPA: hypothetical protein VIX73_03275, partial [Kofleriaceae bacterium]
MNRASVYLRCNIEQASREAMTAMLASCGVAAAFDADPAPAVAALVFIDAIDPAVLDIVQCAGDAGASPILVIDVGADALPGEACWQLLAAGAS